MKSTNTLLFDAGNTRFKWALVRDGRMQRQQARPLAELPAFADWLRRAPPVARVVGTNVAGQAFERRLRSVLRAAGRPAPQFITSSAVAAGVKSGYTRPQQLGADRWAGLVGAWHLAGRRAVCVASIGTAITLDVVDRHGKHRGGLIAPGPALMLEALLARTADIAARAGAATPAARSARSAKRTASTPLANTTRTAIEEGCLAAACGLIERTILQATHLLGTRPVVFVTGGASAGVVARLHGRIQHCDDLVLRGIAVLGEVPIRRRA